MKKNKGFTLIELLVVIAIIGVLSAVVLASLNSARAKGADAAIKSNLDGIRAQAEILYDTSGNYNTVCGRTGIPRDTTIANAMKAAQDAGGGTAQCSVQAATVDMNTWAYSMKLKTPDTNPSRGGAYWCVDSAGYSGYRSGNIGPGTPGDADSSKC